MATTKQREFDAALLKARGLTRDDLLAHGRKALANHDQSKPFSTADYKACGGEIPYNKIVGVFGSWKEFCEAIGAIPSQRGRKSMQDNEILDALNTLWGSLNRQPTLKDCNNAYATREMSKGIAGFPSLTTICNRFGSLADALRLAVDRYNEQNGE